MATSRFTRLAHRAVIRVSGEDRADFLQGLISNDIKKAVPGHGIWSGFLTPQGKFLHDLFITPWGDDFLIEVEAERADAFAKKLSMFKLKSKVAIARAPEFSVFAAWGPGAPGAFGLVEQAGESREEGTGTVMVDPRLAEAGLRAVLPDAVPLEKAGFAEAPFEEWDAMRMSFGLPDGSRDMQVEGTLLLEAGFDELGGVDFKKGCYMGQETTTRSKHRNLIKKRLMPVVFDGPAPAPGTPVTLDGAEAGEIRSTLGSQGIALIRLEKLKAAGDAPGAFASGDAKVTPKKPAWAVFPEAE